MWRGGGGGGAGSGQVGERYGENRGDLGEKFG